MATKNAIALTIQLVRKPVFDRVTNLPLRDENGKPVTKLVWERNTKKTLYVLPGSLTFAEADQKFAEADAQGLWSKMDDAKTKLGQDIATIPFEKDIVESHETSISGAIKIRTSASVNDYNDVPEELV